MLDKNLNILIVGLGLMGGSYAKALTENGYKVNAITKIPRTSTLPLSTDLCKMPFHMWTGSLSVRPTL